MMKKIILIKGKAGLGNRVLSTLCGIIFGLMSGRRIAVDWTDGAYAAPGTNAFPQLFASPCVEGPENFSLGQSVERAIWKDHLNWTVADMIGAYAPNRFQDPIVYRKFCCDLSTLEHVADIIVYWSYLPKFKRIAKHFRGEFAPLRGLPEHALIKELMTRYMPFQPVIADEVSGFAARQFRGPMIGVHVRYSDRSTPIEKVRKELAGLLAREPEATIFLATDNRAIEVDFLRRYPRVVLTEKWLPEPGQAVHYNDKNADLERSAVEALKDISLLSRCDYLIYPRSSTFSYLARCIGDFNDETAIDVERHSPIVHAKRLIQEWA